MALLVQQKARLGPEATPAPVAQLDRASDF
jgi:hypothetical protein